MKGAIVAAAFAAGVAASAHNGHMAFHNRRGEEYFASSAADVCTVYTTVYVYPTGVPSAVANTTLYVYPSPVPQNTTTLAAPSNTTTSCTEEAYTPAPVPSSSSSVLAYTPAPKPSSTAQAYTPAPAPSSSKAVVPVYSAPAYTPKPASSSKAASPKPSSYTPSYGHGTGSYAATGRIVTKGNKWAMTYTPYAESGDCKTAAEVQHDIAAIAAMGFTTIRSYSTDCGVFENVVPACQAHGLKVIYGIFIEGGGSSGKGPFSSYANDQLEEIKNNAPKDSVAMIIAGNEAIFNGYTTAEEMAPYLDYVRSTLQSAGFPSEIAVTTTEPVDIWQQYGAPLCSHIDVFAVQIHPYFTSSVDASQAGSFVKSQLALAAAVCPEAAKAGQYVTESGWPHYGDSNGDAHATPEDQKIAIKSILEEVGTETCLFSYQDDKWKNAGSLNVEQSFGCSDVL